MPPTDPSAPAPVRPATLPADLAAEEVPARRYVRVASLVVLVALVLIGITGRVAETAAEPEGPPSAAAEQAAWVSALRGAPAPIRGGLADGLLEPGDAEVGGRFVDFYTYEHADSSVFAVVVASAAFAPDVTVSTPDGRRLAASNLRRTGARAEVAQLRAPGRYTIDVTSVEAGASGAYVLRVGPLPPPAVLVEGDRPRLDTLHGTAAAEQAYLIEAAPGVPVIVSVVSEAFAPRLHLLGPAGEIVEGRTEERLSSDGLHGAVLRYRPVFEAPYTLLVSAGAPGTGGAYALEARAAEAPLLAENGRPTAGELGPKSWVTDGRYADTYRFRASAGTEIELDVQSGAFAPSVRLWRVAGAARTAVGAEAARRAGAVRLTRTLAEGGDFLVEVTAAGEPDSKGVPPPLVGPYTIALATRRPDPPPTTPRAGETSTFPVQVQRSARTREGRSFEVGVVEASVSHPGGRTRVQLTVTVRSVDYAGPWAPWRSFAEKAALRDNLGRSFAPAPAESRTASGILAEPGSVRRGTVVFYAEGGPADLRRLVFQPSLSADGQVTVTLPFDVPH
ncbi:MAG: hypothetical protein ACK41D_07570 [Rubricoccaceae bacterium]